MPTAHFCLCTPKGCPRHRALCIPHLTQYPRLLAAHFTTENTETRAEWELAQMTKQENKGWKPGHLSPEGHLWTMCPTQSLFQLLIAYIMLEALVCAPVLTHYYFRTQMLDSLFSG